MTESKTGFRFWWFFFSLKGRVTRVPFAAFVLGSRLIMEAAAFILSAIYSDYLQSHDGEISDAFTALHVVLGLIILILLWPQFAVITKRLHDIALPMWIGLLWFLPKPGQFFVSFWFARPRAHALPLPYTTLSLFVTALDMAVLLGVLALSFIPGTPTSNRYGPHPHRPDPSAADLF